MDHKPYIFAIVGLGPRGGYALECLVSALANLDVESKLQIVLFDDSNLPGGGPVYRQDQPTTNWINITERALGLPSRPKIKIRDTLVPQFPGYHEWADLIFENWPDERPDSFPPRSEIGQYLNERYLSLAEPLIAAGLVTLTKEKVTGVQLHNKQCLLTTKSGVEHLADDVLLTVGHQPTEYDEQLYEWSKLSIGHANLTLHTTPYPIEDLVSDTSEDTPNNIAVRGYGLAMMDVARAFAGEHGQFIKTDGDADSLTYEPKFGNFCVAPFSLDGLAMGPKPYTPKIDAPYVPADDVLNALNVSLRDKKSQIQATSSEFLVNKVAPIIAKVFRDLPNTVSSPNTNKDTLEEVISAWLRDPGYEHILLMPRNVHPSTTLKSFIEMAMGRADIYLDYCAGQVWRHCQPTIYSALSHSELHDNVLAEIIALDERSKRYSFGPPVESLQQLLAMFEAGVLDLDILCDPDISFDSNGWTLSTGSHEFVADTMINSVLDGPDISKITSPLLKSLLDEDLIQPAHDKLGVMTDPAGYIKSGRDNEFIPIAILGRIAKGTVIGVDAILECFGERPMVWAKSAVEKMAQSTNNDALHIRTK